MDKTLYIMIGAPGSGKTTYVRENAEPGHSAHISRDRIRFSMVKENEAYFSKEDSVKREFIEQIRRAILCPWVDEVWADATNLTKYSRKDLLRSIGLGFLSVNCVKICPVVIMPPLETCLKQNSYRTGREYVPEIAVKRMYNNYTSPEEDDIVYNSFIWKED